MLIAYCPLWASLRWVCRNPLYTPHHSPQVIIYIRIPLSLLLSGWTVLALSVFSYERCSNLSIFVAPDFAWICLCLPCTGVPELGLTLQMSLTSAEKRGGCPLVTCWQCFSLVIFATEPQYPWSVCCPPESPIIFFKDAFQPVSPPSVLLDEVSSHQYRSFVGVH